MDEPVSRQSLALFEYAREFQTFQTESEWAKRGGGPAVTGNLPPPKYDFVTGNPYEMPLPAIGEALARASLPQHKDWFAYTMSNAGARRVVATAVSQRIGADVEPEDVFLTNGGFAALSAAMRVVADPGEEIVIFTPCFFFYESMIAAVGAVPVRVPTLRPSFDPDLAALEAAITPKTAAVLINSPNNPSGCIYQPDVLEKLAAILSRASANRARPIYLLSDEAFSRIIYDNAPFHSPTRFYPHSLLLYTYGKTLLAPGERLGYIAATTLMPERVRRKLRQIIPMAQIAGGWLFPNATLQYAIADLDQHCIDLTHMQRNRDDLVAGLRRVGYAVDPCQATFFLMVKSPWEDDVAYARHLVNHEVFVLPGSIAYAPGYFRMSLGVTSATVEGSLTAFEAAFKAAADHR